MSWKHYFWADAEPWRSVRFWAVPRILQVAHSALMCTARITTTGVAQGRRRLERGEGCGALLVCWHDSNFVLLHLFRHQNIGVLSSYSRVGQLNAAFWRLYGWPTVFGSSKKREGVKALREVVRLLRSGQSFAFTPDGPQGPRHQAQPGVVFLATHAPAVVIPVGIAASSSWRLPTWDRYMIPKPFARIHVHVADALLVPANLSRQEMEEWRGRVQDAINDAEAVATEKVEGRRGSRVEVRAGS